MYFVFCQVDDYPALWTYQGLKSLGLTPIEVVTAPMLAFSTFLEHRVSPDSVAFRLRLANGLEIDSSTVSGVLNRLQSLPMDHLKASKADQEYASQEIFALFISWMYSLECPVLNPATSQGLSGQCKHASEWAMLSHKAGLKTMPYAQSSDYNVSFSDLQGKLMPTQSPYRLVFAVGGRYVIPQSTPQEIAQGCLRLSQLIKTPLLGVYFASTTLGEWTFAGASAYPDLRLGGQALLKAVASALKMGKEELQV